MSLLARSMSWAKPFVTASCLPWESSEALAGLSLNRQNQQLPSAILSLAITGGCSHHSYTVSVTTSALSLCCHCSLMWEVLGKSCTLLPRKGRLEMARNQHTACTLIIPSLLCVPAPNVVTGADKHRTRCCEGGIASYRRGVRGAGGQHRSSTVLPVTCASALLSRMIQLQLFCGSNALTIFSSSHELSAG